MEPLKVAELGDYAYKTVAPFLPDKLVEWPEWSSPVLREAALRAISAQSMARETAAASSNQHPVAPTSRNNAQGTHKRATLMDKEPPNGDDEAPSPKKKKMSRKPVKKIGPQVWSTSHRRMIALTLKLCSATNAIPCRASSAASSSRE